MAIILFKKGTGQPVKMNEFGFEHSIASGNYFLTKDEAINAGRIPAAPPVEFPFSTPRFQLPDMKIRQSSHFQRPIRWRITAMKTWKLKTKYACGRKRPGSSSGGQKKPRTF